MFQRKLNKPIADTIWRFSISTTANAVVALTPGHISNRQQILSSHQLSPLHPDNITARKRKLEFPYGIKHLSIYPCVQATAGEGHSLRKKYLSHGNSSRDEHLSFDDIPFTTEFYTISLIRICTHHTYHNVGAKAISLPAPPVIIPLGFPMSYGEKLIRKR